MAFDNFLLIFPIVKAHIGLFDMLPFYCCMYVFSILGIVKFRLSFHPVTVYYLFFVFFFVAIIISVFFCFKLFCRLCLALLQNILPCKLPVRNNVMLIFFFLHRSISVIWIAYMELYVFLFLSVVLLRTVPFFLLCHAGKPNDV